MGFIGMIIIPGCFTICFLGGKGLMFPLSLFSLCDGAVNIFSLYIRAV